MKKTNRSVAEVGENVNGEMEQDQSRSKQRKPRSDRGNPRTTDRDLTALQWLSQQWGAPEDQIGRLLRPDTPSQSQTYTAAAAVRRWRNYGWVDTGRVQVGAPRWVWPKAFMSARMLGFETREWTPSPVRVAHMSTVNAVRLSYPQGWVSERLLLHEVGFRGEGDRVRVPDGLCEVSGRRLLLEVELSRKSNESMAEAVRGWPDACERWGADGVLWVSSRALYEHMQAAVGSVKAKHPNGVGGLLARVGVVWSQEFSEGLGLL